MKMASEHTNRREQKALLVVAGMTAALSSAYLVSDLINPTITQADDCVDAGYNCGNMQSGCGSGDYAAARACAVSAVDSMYASSLAYCEDIYCRPQPSWGDCYNTYGHEACDNAYNSCMGGHTYLDYCKGQMGYNNCVSAAYAGVDYNWMDYCC